MSETTIELNGIEYIRADRLPAPPAGPPSEYRIVVVDRGWVFVGPTQQLDDGSLVVSPANCIRIWGTSETQPGLGYLAANGPTSKTNLDPSGTVRIPSHAVVLALDTEASKWA